MSTPIDGFWLPRDIRARLLAMSGPMEGTPGFATLAFLAGQPCSVDTPGAVVVRWPLLGEAQWRDLLAQLRANRSRVPRGASFWSRMQEALRAVAKRFADPEGRFLPHMLESLPQYTGYSAPMVMAAVGALDLFALDEMQSAFRLPLDGLSSGAWRTAPGLPGRIRFYPRQRWSDLWGHLPLVRGRARWGDSAAPDLVVGYGAGNVPGTALLIAFLAQATTLCGGPTPAVVVKNSRREPIFAPLVLDALEETDPDLVAATAVLVWDYEEHAVQDILLGQADLAIAAASDETIAQIESQIARVAETRARPLRFHGHGHKVSFSIIGKDVLDERNSHPESGEPLIAIVSLMAAFDSVFWDQYGCLSSRIHFVEEGSDGGQGPGGLSGAMAYGEHLNAHLRVLARMLPRGHWPLRQIHERFDRYKQLEVTGQVQVLSAYDDEFLLLVDRRPLDGRAFYSLLNDCQGRVIVIRPVADLMDIPRSYLALLPARNLQSLSVAVGLPGQGLSSSFLELASACGQCGVTAIRTVGRGAFPQLAYSWDGLIPLDLVRPRPAGHFTTIEFDTPMDQIVATYRLMQERSARMMGGGLS